tara:strand:+ start:143 stop:1093 length:951 start_codon:yes stop_codon:yes gene_type:complete
MPKFKNIFITLTRRGFLSMLIASYYHLVGTLMKILNKKFITKKIYNYKMLLDLYDKGISRTLLLFGKRELEHKKMLENIIKPEMTVLDIGANIGYYSLMMLELMGNKGKLIAVEPSPSNIEILRKNLLLNKYNDIEVHNAAISDENGTKKFFLSEMSNLNTLNYTEKKSLNLTGETINVKTLTVPQIMEGRNLDLIRMDVEGHEVEVLNGLIPNIGVNNLYPSIIFETHRSRYNNEHSMENTLKNLFAKNYKVSMLGSTSKEGTKKIEAKGYIGTESIQTDEYERVIFKNIKEQDAIDLICNEGGVRCAVLEHTIN